jgi:hypothetical protein
MASIQLFSRNFGGLKGRYKKNAALFFIVSTICSELDKYNSLSVGQILLL